MMHSSAQSRHWPTKTEDIEYLHGLSSRDFVPPPGEFLGSNSACPRRWKAEQCAFADRDPSGVDYGYLWAAGVHSNVCLEGTGSACW